MSVRIVSLIAASFLLLPLLLQPVRQIIFLAQSGEIRKLESTDGKLERMVFSAHSFARLNFTRENREFIYRGNQYDIYSITKSRNQVVVQVLWDRVESQMLQDYISKDQPDDTSLSNVTQVGFMPYFFVNSLIPGFKNPETHQAGFSILHFNCPEPWYRICSPPPKLLTLL